MEHIDFYIFFTLSGILSIYDIRTFRVPNIVVLPGIFTVLLVRILMKGADLICISSTVWGFLFFLSVHRITRGKLGLGDAKYSAFMGAVLGPEGWYISVLLAVTCAGAFFLLQRINRKPVKGRPVPFVPFLFTGSLLFLFFHIFIF